ncbi:lanthionine synthetase LanC family protein [Streptomyces sp. NPDC021115]
MNTTAHAQAAARALDIACDLRNPADVAASVSDRAAHTLCYGLAGTALLHACLAETEPGAAKTAAAHWDAAARSLGKAPPEGIHTGPGSLAASLIIGTGYLPSHDPHQALLSRATAWLSARAAALARHHYQRAARAEATPWAVYDAIKGLTGIGRVLLAAHNRGHRADAEPGLHAALTALTHMILTPIGTRPGWWLPAALHPPTVRIPPSGAATTGLAHGIAGPLALLATAHRAGHTVPGQRDAIHTAAHWLLTWENPQHRWPPHVSGNALDNSPQGTTSPIAGRIACSWGPLRMRQASKSLLDLRQNELASLATTARSQVALLSGRGGPIRNLTPPATSSVAVPRCVLACIEIRLMARLALSALIPLVMWSNGRCRRKLGRRGGQR